MSGNDSFLALYISNTLMGQYYPFLSDNVSMIVPYKCPIISKQVSPGHSFYVIVNYIINKLTSCSFTGDCPVVAH